MVDDITVDIKTSVTKYYSAAAQGTPSTEIPVFGPPRACFDLYPEGNSRTKIRVDATCSIDPSGRGALKYEWDWADGTKTVEGPITSHYYPCTTDKPGYKVRLTVYIAGDRAHTDQTFSTRVADDDFDGLLSCEEDNYWSSDRKPDTDDDGISDYAEVKGLDIPASPSDSPRYTSRPAPKVETTFIPMSAWSSISFFMESRDTDADGIGDRDEYWTHRTNPRDPDTDGDGSIDSVDRDPHTNLIIVGDAKRYRMHSAGSGAASSVAYSLCHVAQNKRICSLAGGQPGSAPASAPAGQEQTEHEPAWNEVALDVPDSFPLLDLRVGLWDDRGTPSQPNDDTPIAVGPGPGSECRLVFDVETGTWTSDDYPRTPAGYDPDGYGHCSAADTTATAKGEIWFQIYQPTHDGDRLPFAFEMADKDFCIGYCALAKSDGQRSLATYSVDGPTEACHVDVLADCKGLNPFQNDGEIEDDLDGDGLPNSDEVRWGLNPRHKDVHAFKLKVATNFPKDADGVPAVGTWRAKLAAMADQMYFTSEGLFMVSGVEIHYAALPNTDEWNNADIRIYPATWDAAASPPYSTTCICSGWGDATPAALYYDAWTPGITCPGTNPCKTDLNGAIRIPEFVSWTPAPDSDGTTHPETIGTGQLQVDIAGQVLAHEWSHYAYGLQDEYYDATPNGLACPAITGATAGEHREGTMWKELGLDPGDKGKATIYGCRAHDTHCFHAHGMTGKHTLLSEASADWKFLQGFSSHDDSAASAGVQSCVDTVAWNTDPTKWFLYDVYESKNPGCRSLRQATAEVSAWSVIFCAYRDVVDMSKQSDASAAAVPAIPFKEAWFPTFGARERVGDSINWTGDET